MRPANPSEVFATVAVDRSGEVVTEGVYRVSSRFRISVPSVYARERRGDSADPRQEPAP
jgi:hypothetical protein